MSKPVPRSGQFERWWPTTQSLDLVHGTLPQVAEGVESEVARCVRDEALTTGWFRHADLDAAFSAATEFANVPTHYVLLPTHSNWTVLWTNSFLCEGYDSLCHCLTVNHGMTSIHWNAHDSATTTQPGATLARRSLVGATLVERSVCVAQNDGNWLCGQTGLPLPEEDSECYEAPRKRDRLNEQQLVELLERPGAMPWTESFYALREQPCFALKRMAAPPTIIRRARPAVVSA